MAQLQPPQSGGGEGIKMPKRRPVHALLGGGLGSQQSACSRTVAYARDRKARPPSAHGWEIMPWPQPREPAHRADSQQPGMGITCSTEGGTTFLYNWEGKQSCRKGVKEKKQPTKLCLKMGVSLNRNLNLLSPDSYGHSSVQSGMN